ncbi:hypothetical protein DSM106972_016010 [Dulcicalothrix desertica PCC 7102]|uniref:Uncharacterized protein n=1 Tax=Dulcicalothrix desertica PCC 7102 TaxID=232991 RepID=A0A3S1DED6_9CYAN|nr:hypothetical protein [Dulcicalothrix desertica]RUT08433.1 hypothetical protein DSM106972_016010 [Dulcicalothrix desertica PCC 7102]TWH40298.1 hypothetical protein CAL7102_09605 [Dulcicalothrix desertica PCC 7102]
MTLIPTHLIDSLIDINNKVLNHKIIDPHQLAAALEEVAENAWQEVEKRALLQTAYDVAPSLRIDP